ncbi:MAG: AAA family ATPase, partial [Proteobacteria bacterium]|nr:AAA family ATPase [Pseudomonadota bacterium]
MKSILISAPASGSGKTTITLGLIRALKNKGLDVCAYK